MQYCLLRVLFVPPALHHCDAIINANIHLSGVVYCKLKTLWSLLSHSLLLPSLLLVCHYVSLTALIQDRSTTTVSLLMDHALKQYSTVPLV